MNMNNQIRGPIQIHTPGPLASAPGPVQMAATGALAGLLADLLPVPAPAFPVVLSPGFCDFNPTTGS